MCGRYTLTNDGKDLWELIEASLPEDLRKDLTAEQVSLVMDAPDRRKFNIVPTSIEPILFNRDGQTVFTPAHWWCAKSTGAKTFSWKGPPKSHFNSRWDTVTSSTNKYWNGLLDKNRCLVPADGFVEWPDDALRDKRQDKIPSYFSLHEHRPYFFAGIYDIVNDDEGKPFLSYNIITVEPNEQLKALPHHRMPAILTYDSAKDWLSPEVRARDAAKLLRTTLDEFMVSYQISKLVNSPGNESPSVVMPLGARPESPEGNPLFL
jgi:putative SOS response-associated peptidase YedK